MGQLFPDQIRIRLAQARCNLCGYFDQIAVEKRQRVPSQLRESVVDWDVWTE